MTIHHWITWPFMHHGTLNKSGTECVRATVNFHLISRQISLVCIVVGSGESPSAVTRLSCRSPACGGDFSQQVRFRLLPLSVTRASLQTRHSHYPSSLKTSRSLCSTKLKRFSVFWSALQLLILETLVCWSHFHPLVLQWIPPTWHQNQ